jgi:hypothetical protein
MSEPQACLTGQPLRSTTSSSPGKQQKLIGVMVRPCEPPGFLGTIARISLVGKAERIAQDELLQKVEAITKGTRLKPGTRPAYPATAASTQRAPFPGSLPPVWHVPPEFYANSATS